MSEAIRPDRFRHIVDLANEGIWILDADDRTNYINERGASILGYRQEEMIGRPVTDFLFSDLGHDVEGVLSELRAGMEKAFEFQTRCRDGTLAWRSVSMMPLMEDDHYSGAVAIFSDITERKKAQESLQRSEAMLREIITNLPIVLWAADLDGTFTLSEGKGLAGIGLRPGEVVGRSAFDMYRDHPAVTDAMRKALFGMESSYIVNISGITFQVWNVPLRDEHNAVTGLLGVAFDITEQNALEMDLKRSNEDLQQFAYVASHDLQEPLRVIAAHLSLLEKNYDGKVVDERARANIHYAVDGAERMRRLIDDLLAFSRLDAQGKAPESIDMGAVLSAALNDLRGAVEGSGASITSDPLPSIVADRTQMVLLFENLIGNAIKFRGEGAPAILISARSDNDEWIISVKDNGIGIDPRYHANLFKMFSRLHTGDEYPGTGIGLAIAKKIVDRHGGRIWFESEPGKGTTFFFTIPKSRSDGRAE